MDVSTDVTTVSEFLALNPGDQLKFARSLGDRITPEVVALLIYTYLNAKMVGSRTRPLYGEALMPLIKRVDPVALVVLADRLVSTTAAKGEFLVAHQNITTILARLTELNRAYFSLGNNGELFIGTLSHRMFPRNHDQLQKAGVRVNDAVLYDPTRVLRDRTSGRRLVYMVLVPQNDDLPQTLGL